MLNVNCNCNKTKRGEKKKDSATSNDIALNLVVNRSVQSGAPTRHPSVTCQRLTNGHSCGICAVIDPSCSLHAGVRREASLGPMVWMCWARAVKGSGMGLRRNTSTVPSGPGAHRPLGLSAAGSFQVPGPSPRLGP